MKRSFGRSVLVIIFFVTCRSQGSFRITALPPTTSNIVQVIPFTNSLQAFAGVLYSYTQLSCSESFFGTVAAQVNASLVLSNSSMCSANTRSLMGSPFDGVTRPIDLTQLVTRWGPTKFVSGGSFTLCVSVATTSTILPISISVRGMYETSNKMYCMYSNSTDCTVYLQGYDLSGKGDAKLALVEYPSGVCGTSSLKSTFSNISSTATEWTVTSETHNFGGPISNSSTNPIASYVVCYCPSYQAAPAVGGAVCTSSLSANFVQTVGVLVLTSVSTSDPNTGVPASVYPRAAFDLKINCGSGGCSQDLTPRFKLVDSRSNNRKPYYFGDAGCRAALQSTRYIGPPNCDYTATGCAMDRSDPTIYGGQSSVIYRKIILDNELVNSVSMDRSFDVCFCDSKCSQQASWFMVGSIHMLSLHVTFSVGGGTVMNSPSVNFPGSINIKGATPSSGTLRTSGTETRVMKLIFSDNAAGMLANSETCWRELQSTQFVAGYDCYSASSCDAPYISTSSSLSYGRDLLQVRIAGWAAVCFCNEQCGTASTWFVAGRILFSGPSENQQWQAYSNLAFSITISGWGLSAANSLLIVDGTDTDCADIASTLISSFVVGPSETIPALLGGADSRIVNVVDGFRDVIGGNGTNIFFTSPHRLVSFDRISVSGLFTGNLDYDAMLNSDFTVRVIDPFRININVQFAPGQFPSTVNVTQANWWRSSTASFGKFYVSKPGAYTVCWNAQNTTTPRLFGGKAGTITVIDPPLRTGNINTSLAVNNTPSIFGLEFTTSSSPAYVDPLTGKALVSHLKVVFNNPTDFTPLLTNGSIWTYPPSIACSLLFSNFSSTDSGFAPPTNCSIYIDKTPLASRYELHMQFGENDSIRPSQSYALSVYANWTNQSQLVQGTGSVQVWIFSRNDSSVVEVVRLKPTSICFMN